MLSSPFSDTTEAKRRECHNNPQLYGEWSLNRLCRRNHGSNNPTVRAAESPVWPAQKPRPPRSPPAFGPIAASYLTNNQITHRGFEQEKLQKLCPSAFGALTPVFCLLVQVLVAGQLNSFSNCSQRIFFSWVVTSSLPPLHSGPYKPHHSILSRACRSSPALPSLSSMLMSPPTKNQRRPLSSPRSGWPSPSQAR